MNSWVESVSSGRVLQKASSHPRTSPGGTERLHGLFSASPLRVLFLTSTSICQQHFDIFSDILFPFGSENVGYSLYFTVIYLFCFFFKIVFFNYN